MAVGRVCTLRSWWLQTRAAGSAAGVSCRPSQNDEAAEKVTTEFLGWCVGYRGAHLGDGGSQAGLRLAQDARLRVVVALPGQLPRRTVAQPHKHCGQRLRRVLAAALFTPSAPC